MDGRVAAAKSSSADVTLRILGAIAEPIRFRIVRDIVQNGPTTATPLGTRVGADSKRVSRNLQVLAESGVLERWLGRVFRIPEKFLVPGEPVVDFGTVRVRFD
jgi:predicted transcriptional regulator